MALQMDWCPSVMNNYQKQSSMRSILQFSHSVVSDSLWPHESQHARPPCPSPTPGVHSNSCPLSQWCHPSISSCRPFSCPQSFPISGSFLVSWLFASGGQSIGASASVSVFPVNIQSWFPLGLTGLILLFKGLSSLFQHHSLKVSILWCSASFMAQLSHLYMTTEKPKLWVYRPLSAKWCLCFLIHCLGLS